MTCTHSCNLVLCSVDQSLCVLHSIHLPTWLISDDVRLFLCVPSVYGSLYRDVHTAKPSTGEPSSAAFGLVVYANVLFGPSKLYKGSILATFNAYCWRNS